MRHAALVLVVIALGGSIAALSRQVNTLLADRSPVVRMAELPDGIDGTIARAVILPGNESEQPIETTVTAPRPVQYGHVNAVVEQTTDGWIIRGYDR